jgi:hypothetical protein
LDASERIGAGEHHAANERTIVVRNKIEDMRELPVSLIPENLLKELKPKELRDVFGYLHRDKPVQPRR